ncbi:hypothetical protein STEG23_022686, partial [Scotinomys teguina]
LVLFQLYVRTGYELQDNPTRITSCGPYLKSTVEHSVTTIVPVTTSYQRVIVIALSCIRDFGLLKYDENVKTIVTFEVGLKTFWNYNMATSLWGPPVSKSQYHDNCHDQQHVFGENNEPGLMAYLSIGDYIVNDTRLTIPQPQTCELCSLLPFLGGVL